MKKFTITATFDGGKLDVKGENNGFSALEVIGILDLKKEDILDQIKDSTSFERTVYDGDKKIKIKKKG